MLSRRPTKPTEPPTGYSDFQVTWKLEPSVVRDDGSASSVPVLLTMMISCTSLPNALMGSVVEASVA